MKKQTPEEQIARLIEAQNKLKLEVKNLKQAVKYHKEGKSILKAENKQLKSDLAEEVKKTSRTRMCLSEQQSANLERRIKERFPDEETQNVLLELASSFTSESNADFEE